MKFFILDINVLNLLYDKGAIPFITKKTQKLWRNKISFNQRQQFRKNIEHGVIVWLLVCVQNYVIKSKLLLEYCSLSSKIKSNNFHSFQCMRIIFIIALQMLFSVTTRAKLKRHRHTKTMR